MARPTLAIRLGRTLARTIRLTVGIVLIIIGILGVILPLLPATPFFLLATLVIGKQSRLMRHFSVWGKRRLRRLARHEHALVRRAGLLALRLQRETSRRTRQVNRWTAERQRRVTRRLIGA